MSEDAKEAARAAARGGAQGQKKLSAAKERPRIQAWMPDAETDARIRNAWLALGTRKGYASLGELLWRSALERVQEWEQQENHGKPFAPPSDPAMVSVTGRPPRAGHG